MMSVVRLFFSHKKYILFILLHVGLPTAGFLYSSQISALHCAELRQTVLKFYLSNNIVGISPGTYFCRDQRLRIDFARPDIRAFLSAYQY